MTKVTVIGEQSKAQRVTPIEFVKWVGSDTLHSCNNTPSEYKNIELICRKYIDEFDLMFAYDDIRSDGVVYLGHFNDGVVE